MGEGNFFFPSFHYGCLCLLQRRNGSNVAVKICLSEKPVMVWMTDVGVLIEHETETAGECAPHHLALENTHTHTNELIQKTMIWHNCIIPAAKVSFLVIVATTYRISEFWQIIRKPVIMVRANLTKFSNGIIVLQDFHWNLQLSNIVCWICTCVKV